MKLVTAIIKPFMLDEVKSALKGIDVDPAIADDPAYYPPGIIIIEPPPCATCVK